MWKLWYGLPIYKPGEHNTNNKTLIKGKTELSQYQIENENAYKIQNITNNRVVIVLEQNQHIKTTFHVPNGTHMTLITPKEIQWNAIEIDYLASEVHVRAYWPMDNAATRNAQSAYHKECLQSQHAGIAQDVINHNIHGDVHNANILWNSVNRNILWNCVVDRSNPKFHWWNDSFKNVKWKVKIMNDFDHLFEN